MKKMQFVKIFLHFISIEKLLILKEPLLENISSKLPMKFYFKAVGKPSSLSLKDWNNWKWQLRNFVKEFPQSVKTSFKEGASPYYLRLIEKNPEFNLEKIVISSGEENKYQYQEMKDPLGEEDHSPTNRLIHRYPDRILFLITDICGVYCRFCTRKRFTGKDQAFIKKNDYQKVLEYIQKNPGIREVILSGGDPLSLSNSILEKVLEDIRKIEHVEIIRIATRMLVVCPMRFDNEIISILKKFNPVFLMNHFNHPAELSKEVVEKAKKIADAGILMFNQSVLLNGINNHPAILQGLMRRLLFLRIKPYYIFQCDPSEGSDHFRTSVENSENIQRELWGKFSGLALANFSLDIPHGGGKVPLFPDFLEEKSKKQRTYKGWDGIKNSYINPENNDLKQIKGLKVYEKEWLELTKQSYKKNSN